MQLQKVASVGPVKPGLAVASLPPQIVERAVDGLCWVSLFISITSVMLLALEHLLQPEFAEAWKHPVLRVVSLGLVFVSAGFIVVQRQGWLRSDQLMNFGLAYQVMVAYSIALFETAAYRTPNSVVLGHSGIAAWMLLCGFLMPNAPLKAALVAVLSIAMWPLGYWTNLQIFGYEPITSSRLLVWVLPLCIVGVWMYVLNNRIIALYFKEERAESVGSYTLDFRLGYGGMGEVWRAKHRTLARAAAVKLIRPEILYAGTGRQGLLLRRRFEREAQATASLRCPHTVALYDFGQAEDGSFYYVMELLDGIDLQVVVDRFGPMDPGRVVHILLQICQSLEEAHNLGLVHRDIKPKNILLCKLGLQYDFTKVLDFGLVKNLRPDDADISLMSADGLTTGTPAFIPPEVALGQKEIDGRADLYSLGCVAYFLLTGRMVFEERSPTAYAIAHVKTPPPPMRERSEVPVPEKLEAIVMQLLEKDPARRVEGAGELARQLRHLNGLRTWDPELAARWWQTNLPDAAIRRPADDPADRESEATTRSPVGSEAR